MPVLPEQDGAFARRLDGNGSRQHQRREHDEREHRHELVEHPFEHEVPVRYGPIGHLENRQVANIGIGLVGKAQLAHMRAEPDIDRQHPELAQHFEQPGFGRKRHRDDHQIDPRPASELDEIGHLAEFLQPGNGPGRALVVTVVKKTYQFDVAGRAFFYRCHEGFGARSTTHDHCAPPQAALGRPVENQCPQRQPVADQQDAPRQGPTAQPDAGYEISGLEDKQSGNDQQENPGPAPQHAQDLLENRSVGRDPVGAGDVEGDICGGDDAKRKRHIEHRIDPIEVKQIDAQPEREQQRCFDQLGKTRDQLVRNRRGNGRARHSFRIGPKGAGCSLCIRGNVAKYGLFGIDPEHGLASH